ncbi:MAG: hypothetical protein MJ072_01880, partial [Clostridia bacterium]|nr:hypothetical protein [Clostridia bacterium]
EYKKNGESYVGFLFQIDAYNASIEALKNPSTTQFSMGTVSWELSLNDYKPFVDAKRESKELNDRKNDLDVYENVQKAYDGLENARVAAHKMLDEKQSNFDKLNGWQKFWAKVLPASWYSKAEEYNDIQNLKEAMKTVGVTEPVQEEPAQEEPTQTEHVGEPLSDEEISKIEKENELGKSNDQPVADNNSLQNENDTPAKGN